MRNRSQRWLIGIAVVVIALCAALFVASRSLSGYVRDRMVKDLNEKYAGEVQVSDLRVTLFPSIRIEGDRISFHQKNRDGVPPLITIDQASAETNWASVLARHIRTVRLTGLKIQVPPRREDGEASQPHKTPPGFVVDTVVANGTVLTILPKEEGKDPLEFDVDKLTLHGAGPKDSMAFTTILKNAKPPGEINSTGYFGPFDLDDPALTPVSGKFTFQHADLSVFKGISGMLSSEGEYDGELGRINVKGRTDTPDFTVRISGQPVHLSTDYQAVVDGTSGNTYLEPVVAHFGHSTITARGKVEGQKGVKGKTVSLDAEVNDARMEDILRLAVKSDAPTTMTGAISFRSKIVIPPGDIDVAEKLQLDGAFTVSQAHFSALDVQEKVNELSHRGKGNPEENPADSVATNFQGKFQLGQGILKLNQIGFEVPGVAVALNGTFGLLDQKLDLHGTARLEAKLSQMTTGWKSMLLKAVDPFFEKKGAGAVVPIHIGGTAQQPSFTLDVLHKG